MRLRFKIPEWEWEEAKRILAVIGSQAAPGLRARKRAPIISSERKSLSLFSSKRLGFIQLAEGYQSPFSGVRLEPRQSMRYRSAFNCRELLRVARKDLAKDDPEAHKVFLLALCAGLRRGEIDRLEWSAFDWGDQKLHIEITQHLALKSGDSVGAVDLEPQLIETFRDFHSRPTGSFVIESPRSARVGTTYLAYRCGHIFKRLAGWLRKHGVRAAKPLHTLRKEFGSQVCDRHGLFMASLALRHSDIGVTSDRLIDDNPPC